jgi:hypothetical protein
MTLAVHIIVVNSLFNGVGLSLDSEIASSYGLSLNSNSTIRTCHLKSKVWFPLPASGCKVFFAKPTLNVLTRLS